MVDLGSWMGGRTPAPPRGLADHLQGMIGESDTSSRSLASVAILQLNKAIERPGRDREGAFHLLAADALMTYACEIAVDEEDSVEVLSNLLAGLSGGPDPVSGDA